MNDIERLLLKASINLNLMELLEKSKKKDLVPYIFHLYSTKKPPQMVYS